MEAITLENVNAMPAPTWHRLRMNDTTVHLPAGLTPTSEVTVETSEGVRGTKGAFHTSANTHETLATGMGSAAYAWMRTIAEEPLVFATAPKQTAAATVRLCGIDGAANIAAIDVVAEEGSTLDLVVSLDSPTAGSGVVGTSLRIYVGAAACVNLTVTQTLDDTWIALDDTGVFLEADARLNVRSTVLGSSRSYVGFAGDLSGAASNVTMDTRYVGHGTQALDFNYVLRHYGTKTTCALNANGVLTGESEKTLRGTIDFVRGCKGASGQEAETVLLADERASNRTIPVILCDEDDVAGNHGATIGHVQPEQLFYLACRGLSPEAAEQLFTRATLEEAVLSAPDETTRASIVRLATALVDDFEEVCA